MLDFLEKNINNNMKICWDNLEKLKYNYKTGKYSKNTSKNNYVYYIEMDSCKTCGESYLTNIKKISMYCDKSCSSIGKGNPFYGKRHSKKTKEIISKKAIYNINAQKKNGIIKNNLPLYDTYAMKIECIEEVRNNNDILEVKCAYCGKWYIPKLTDIKSRIRVFNGTIGGEARLYCSTLCKKECPIYNQNKYPKGYKKASSREVQPELRQMVFERDNWECQKCGSVKSLHCHHIEGIRWEPIESADIDKCITYCKKCHKEVHQIEECRTIDMKCKEK